MTTGSGPPRSRTFLAPLRHRQFAWFWAAAFISNIGTWMESVSIGVYVTDTTGDALWTGAAAAAAFLPSGLIGPIGGALADRHNRRWILIASNTVNLAVAAVLAVLFFVGDPPPGVVVSLVLVGGVSFAFGFPSYQALLPELVPKEDLMGAIGLSSAQWNLGRVIGPALAGVVIAAGGFGWALSINAATFGAPMIVLVFLHLPPQALAAPMSLRQAIGQGVRFVVQDDALRVTFAAMIVNTLVIAPFIALVPAMAITVFDAGSGGTARLITAQGIGAVAMGVAIGSLGKSHGVRRVLIVMISATPVAVVLYGVAPNLWVSAVALVGVGALYLGTLSTFMTIAQVRAPGELRGRVLSLNTVVLGLLYPLGALVQGALADRVGLREVTVASGLLMLGVLICVRTFLPRALDPLSAADLGSPAP